MEAYSVAETIYHYIVRRRDLAKAVADGGNGGSGEGSQTENTDCRDERNWEGDLWELRTL